MMEPRDIALVIYSCFAVGCLGGMAACLMAMCLFEIYK